MAGVSQNLVTFKLAGTRAMTDHLKRLAERFPKRFGQELRLEAEEIMTLSKQKYVPVDQGTLAGSGFVEGPEFTGSDMEVRMLFGGAAAAHAEAIHEHDSSASPPSWRGKTIKFRGGGLRGVKYLERPMKERSINMASRLARAVRL